MADSAAPGLLTPLAVRSRRLGWAAGVSGSNSLIHACPSDRTAIAKWVSVSNPNATPGLWALQVRMPGPNNVTIAGSNLAATDTIELELWQVYEEGDELRFINGHATGSMTAYVSGALLDGDPV